MEPKFHYCIHKSLPPVRILSWINPVHAFPPSSLRSTLMLIFQYKNKFTQMCGQTVWRMQHKRRMNIFLNKFPCINYLCAPLYIAHRYANPENRVVSKHVSVAGQHYSHHHHSYCYHYHHSLLSSLLLSPPCHHCYHHSGYHRGNGEGSWSYRELSWMCYHCSFIDGNSLVEYFLSYICKAV
jgi:hypothetical protein